jgi:dTDP-4-amino-4,6-dideoxygalactose transaminase
MIGSARTIPFGRPWITDEDRDAVMSVLHGPILTHGPQTSAFEEEFARFMGGGYCVAVSSCTAALHLTYFQMGLARGDEVIVPAQTHNATAHAVELVGAKPVFVDCEPKTGNIDVTRIEAAITARTKAISIVHFLGLPCDMEDILTIAARRGLRVVEDCALALGARYRGVHVGIVGDVGCFSFYPVKHITTGDGGMFVTRHKEIAAAVSKLRAFGVDRTHQERKIPGMYDVDALGLNYRMSEMQAALGRSQLARIDVILRRREENFNDLKSALAGIHGFRVLDSGTAERHASRYCLSIVLDAELATRRDEIVGKLNDAGVGTSVYYPHPVPRLGYYRRKYGYQSEAYPNAAEISDRSIALPVGPHVTREDVEYAAAALSRIIRAVS